MTPRSWQRNRSGKTTTTSFTSCGEVSGQLTPTTERAPPGCRDGPADPAASPGAPRASGWPPACLGARGRPATAGPGWRCAPASSRLSMPCRWLLQLSWNKCYILPTCCKTRARAAIPSINTLPPCAGPERMIAIAMVSTAHASVRIRWAHILLTIGWFNIANHCLTA